MRFRKSLQASQRRRDGGCHWVLRAGSWGKRLRSLGGAVLSALLLAVPLSAATAEEAPLEELEPELIYVELKPTFVTNFGPTDTPRLMYLKTDVSLRVLGRAGAVAADTHGPALRNELVLLLSSLEEISVTTSGGREDARRSALKVLNELLEQEEGEALIEDLLFTNFIVQR